MRTNSMNRMNIADPTDRLVGSRIRQRRMVLGLSQSDLGNELGVTFQQIQKYEKGANRIGASRLHRLAEVLKVAPAFFFENEGDQPPPCSLGSSFAVDELTQFLATTEAQALVKAFQRMPTARLRRLVVALVQEVSNRQS
jgi:transcriptional regulator with XRE-family HTH domain